MTFSRLLLIFIITCLNCFFVTVLAYAEKTDLDEIQSLIIKEKTELDQLNNRIKRQTKDLKKLGIKKYSILKQQQILDDQLKSRERELKIYNWNLKINKNKIDYFSKNIRKNNKKLILQRVLMIKRLRSIYMQGEMYPIKILFSSDNFVDLLTRIKYLERIAMYDGKLFNDYKTRVNALSNKKKSLLSAKAKLLEFKKSAEFKKKDISLEKNKKKNFLARISKEKRSKELLKTELIQASNKLNRLISRLEKKQGMGAGLDIYDKKGRLSFPVKGKVLNNFGRKKDKNLNTYIVYNGVNISSSKGASVRAVFGGKILYTGTLEGYGNIIILGHGKEYHSLYGHLDEFITKVGKIVRSGQIIGRSGDTGSIFGESLYFEIRHKGVPIEPMAWLDGSNK